MSRVLIGIFLGLSLVFVGTSSQAADAKYVGAKKCKSCHKKKLIGNQFAAWQEAKHASAFKTLKDEKSLKIAKEKGLAKPPHEAEECLKCHATAANVKPDQLAGKPLAMADAVQCESCHGPGSLYRKKKVMADHDKSVAAGMIVPDNDTCTACHNDESPSWDPGRYKLADGTTAGFDFDQAAEEIAHKIPEDVKGKYLEIVAERKKAKKSGGGDGEEE